MTRMGLGPDRPSRVHVSRANLLSNAEIADAEGVDL